MPSVGQLDRSLPLLKIFFPQKPEYKRIKTIIIIRQIKLKQKRAGIIQLLNAS